MAVRFVIGRAGTGKTNLFLEEIRDKLYQDPSGSPIIYLVPDQMTFLSETRFIEQQSLAGMIRAQVFSFSRLAWRVLQETGGLGRTHLSSAGLNMLIRKVVEDKKGELTLFGRAIDKPGFMEQVEEMFTEFKHYCVSPEQLLEKQQELEKKAGSRALADKLHDLGLIYHEFEARLFGKYVDTNDYLRLLAEAIPKSSYLQDAEIFIDGFYSFTPQEYMIIEKLMQTSKRLSFALTVDQPFHHHVPDDLHLFRMTGETNAILVEMAKRNGVRIEADICLHQPHRFFHESLKHLESCLETRPVQVYAGDAAVHLQQASNRRAEIEAIAREIRELVRTKGYRYKEIAILVRNGNDYHHLLETIFYDYDIPFFIDQKRPMFHHPLIELIRSTLEIINSHWRYEPIFRAVKTGLLFPLSSNSKELREKMDQLENYVLAYGIKGDKWIKKERWHYRRFRGLAVNEGIQTDEERQKEETINELRQMVAEPILRFASQVKKARTVRDVCQVLFTFLEALDIPAKLEALQEAAEKQGRLLAAREHSQAWNAIVDLLDQYVEILGDENISFKEFALFLDAGLEALKFSLVPPALDQVLVADLEKSRLSDIKAAFVIGMNDGVLPAKVMDDGVLADDDRSLLISNGLPIAPSSRIKLLDEAFIAYRAFTIASALLYVSYPLADEEGKALLPSPYIQRVKELFPMMKEKTVANDPAELMEHDQLDYISHPNTAIAYVSAQLQFRKRQYPVADFWWDVYNFYLENPEWKRRSMNVFSSLFYQNKAKRIAPSTSKALYGDDILASVSRMELFHSCPFSHFATYGLQLREREMYRLAAPDIGELFHSALEWIGKEVDRRNVAWSSLTKDQCTYLAKEAITFLAPKLQNQILLSSNRYRYVTYKLEQIVRKASQVLSEHAKVSGFQPIGMEVDFGPNGTLPPFHFRLKNGSTMKLRGRIDRVDQAKNAQGTYLRVIDFKSSTRDVDVTEIYYGIYLQMLTYLDMVITHANILVGTEASPAGVLYFHLHHPIVKSNQLLTMDEIEDDIMKSFKMKGLLLQNEEVVKLMDKTLENGSSRVVSAGLKKDGTFTARSRVVAEEDFTTIRGYVRKLYEKAGNDIVSGVADIAPYRLQNRTPCQFCAYQPVCQLDQSLEENHFRVISPQNEADILERMRKEEMDHEDGHSS